MASIAVAAALISSMSLMQLSSYANAVPDELLLTAISTNFNSPIGIDHYEPTNSVVVSVNYPSGSPNGFEKIEADGSHTTFSSVNGFTDEVKIATVRSGNVGGFTIGDLFTGNGVDGQIARITDDGATVDNPWADLPGSGNGLMRGSLYVDRTGVFGGDLIVVTTAGEVWRIDSTGSATFLNDVDVHLEGVITVPDDDKYGPLAGKIIAGAEEQSRLYTFDTTGAFTFYTLNVPVEDIDLIPANENFYGVNFGTGSILGAPASEFSSMVGEIMLTSELGGTETGLFLLKWDGSALTTEEIPLQDGSDTRGQWEHVTFSTAGIVEIPPAEICGDGIDNDGDGSIDEDCPVEDCEDENVLLADAGVIGIGGTTELTQKIDTCGGLTGEIQSWTVLDADGDTCVADDLPAAIPSTGLVTREFPTEFSIAIDGGDGECDTGDVGIYNSETQVAINGVVEKFTHEFETNFFVIPESPVGVAALMGSALAVLGGFLFLKNRSSGKNDGMIGAGPGTL